MRHLVYGVLITSLLVGIVVYVTSPERADVVYQHGKIYTVNTDQVWAQAVAISNGKFIRVGNNEEMEDLIGIGTEVIDLKGKMVIPSLHDMHIHPVMGALKELYELSVPFTMTSVEIVAAVKLYSEQNKNAEWITGGGWKLELFADGAPHKAMLDQVVPERPVALWDISLHKVWLNSRALEIAGITAETPDPEDGIIVRDAAGEPTGILMEAAALAMHEILPQPGLTKVFRAVRWAAKDLNSYGVTSIMDAVVPAELFGFYTAMDFFGTLNLRVYASMLWDDSIKIPAAEWDWIEERGSYRSERVNPDFVKIMLDGVPFAKTGAMLDDYKGDPGNNGALKIDQAKLNQDLIDFDKAGLTVKIHAAGDRAVRVALNAIESARKANGSSGPRHQVAHAGFIHPNDLSRFHALNAVVEVSPVLWHPSKMHSMGSQILSEGQLDRQYPIKSLIEAGTLVVAGTDWPAVVPNANPWYAIESMVTRKHPLGELPGVLGEEEAIDLATALRIFTINAAHALRLEAMTGSIEVGKFADMAVLEKNLFEVPADQVSETQVIRTVLAGKTVYQYDH